MGNRLKRAALVLAVLSSGVTTAAAGNSSVYTSLDLDQCAAQTPAADDPLQSTVWWCDGHAGIPVRVAEGDLRYLVSYGDDAANEIAASQTLPAFNTIHTTLEWRVGADGQPLATILRFFTQTGDGADGDQFLVITKLGGAGQICQIGFINASINSNANEIAREVADNAVLHFRCGVDNPLAYGLTGDDARS